MHASLIPLDLGPDLTNLPDYSAMSNTREKHTMLLKAELSSGEQQRQASTEVAPAFGGDSLQSDVSFVQWTLPLNDSIH